LSQGSKFNTRPISEDNKNKSKDMGPITIPETIIPPIVNPIINDTSFVITDELVNNVINGNIPLTNNTILIKPPITEENNEETGELSEYEIEILKKIATLREITLNREARKSYNEWVKYYSDDLKQMYETCIYPDLEFSYEQFVRLAYKCSEKEFNPKKLKYTRPLI
jgi:hypothetical protein